MRAARSSRLTLAPARAGEWRKNEQTGELEQFYFRYDAIDEVDQFPRIMVTVESNGLDDFLARMQRNNEWSERTCARVA